MRLFTNCYVSLAMGGLLAVAGCVQGVLWATGDCQIPNPNTKLCAATPEDSIGSCEDGNPNIGSGCGVKVYEISNFPNGTSSSSSGTTAEEQADCKRSKDCILDLDAVPQKCKASTTGWSGWSQATKTIVGTNECPPVGS